MADDNNIELQYSLETIENVPEEYKGLYVENEKDGKKFYQLNVTGVKPIEEFDNVHKTLLKVREERNNFEKNVKAFGEWTPDKIKAVQEELDSLKKAKNSATEDDFLKRLNEVKTANEAERVKLKDEFNKAEMEYKKQLQEKENMITEMRLESALTALYNEKGDPSGRDLAIQLAKNELVWNADNNEFRTKDGLSNLKDWMNDEMFKKHECLLKPSLSSRARETGGSASEYEKYFNPNAFDRATFDDPNGEPYRKRLEFYRKNPERAKELFEAAKQDAIRRREFLKKLI